MKIKIKNKDNKLFVALVLIAALMMVSVAGVVMSDNSNANGDNVPMEGMAFDGTDAPIIVPNITIGSGSAVAYNLYPDTSEKSIDGTTYTYVIPNTNTYTGTINLGTMESGKFVAVHSVKLTDVSSAVITVKASWTQPGINGATPIPATVKDINVVTSTSITVTTYNTTPTGGDLTNYSTSGTFEVTKGAVIFGNSTGDKYFTGTSNGIEMANIENLMITNNGGSIGLSGISVTGGEQLKVPKPAAAVEGKDQPVLTVDSKITVTANVTVGNLALIGTKTTASTAVGVDSLDNSVELIINEGITATVKPTTNDRYGVHVETNSKGSVSAKVKITSGNITQPMLNKVSLGYYTDPFTGYKTVSLGNLNDATTGATSGTFGLEITVDGSTYNGIVTKSSSGYVVTGFGTTTVSVEQTLGVTATGAGNIQPTEAKPIGYNVGVAANTLTYLYNATSGDGVKGYKSALAINISNPSDLAEFNAPTAHTNAAAIIQFTDAFANNDIVVIALEKANSSVNVDRYDYFIGKVSVDTKGITGITPMTGWNSLTALAGAGVPGAVGKVSVTGTDQNLQLMTDTTGWANMGLVAYTSSANKIEMVTTTEVTAGLPTLVVQKDADNKYYFGVVKTAIGPTADFNLTSVANVTIEDSAIALSTSYGVALTSKNNAETTNTIVGITGGVNPYANASGTNVANIALNKGSTNLDITTKNSSGVTESRNIYKITVVIDEKGQINATVNTKDYFVVFSNKYSGAAALGDPEKLVESILTINATNTMTVTGSLVAIVEDTTKITSNSGIINVTGMITTGEDALTGTVNAVHYASLPTSTTVRNYYTTLATAMTNSSDITVMGEIDIKEDIELKGSSEATPVSNSITIASGAVLTIGDVDEDNKVSAIVTVPATTNLVVTGIIDVENGQFKWTTADLTPIANVYSDVFITEDNTGVYTDLTTSLTLATEGSDVTLRVISGGAEIATEATVAKGVTLIAGNTNITVKAGGKLTVNGELTSSANLTIDAAGDGKSAGEFIANTKDVSFGNMTLKGVFTIGSDAVITEDAGITVVAKAESTPAVINVNGTFTNNAVITGSSLDYLRMNIAGKYVSSTTIDTYSMIFVTGELNATQDLAINEVTVTGNGKVTVSENAIVSVSKSAYLGDAATTATIAAGSTNNTEVKISLTTTAFATVYGKPADGKVGITPSTVKTEIDLGSNELYATVYAGAAGVLISAIDDPTIVGFVFNGFYTSPDFATTKIVPTDATIGGAGYTKIYAKMDIQTFTISFKYDAGIKWLLDGVEVEGNQKDIVYGQHSVSFTFMDGYSGDVKLTMNGNSYKAGDNFTLDENGNEFNSDGAHKTVPGNSMDMIEILLIVITIVFVIVAIVVIMRLMRS